jgi:CheY-like chemotaxis protein
MSLPDMDGYQVAGTLRERYGSTCRIVAVTGHSGPDDRAAASRAGCDAYLVKPFDRSDILRHLVR